jgi:hypothetical protein
MMARLGFWRDLAMLEDDVLPQTTRQIEVVMFSFATTIALFGLWWYLRLNDGLFSCSEEHLEKFFVRTE